MLTISVVLTLAATFYMKYEEEKDAKREFTLLCNDLKTKIYARLHAHAQLLRSGSAFFAASDTVTRSEWKKFYESAKISKNLPGIQGFGFSVVIHKNQLQHHIQYVRKQGFQDYTIHPAGDRAIYTSIIYLEPFSGRNLLAFGYDMFSEPIRRKAMELACDSDIAILSDKVILVQETDKDYQAGTLMFVPVYRNGMPVNTVEQRHAAIKGWIYSPFRMNDLMLGILGQWDINRQGRIHLQVYDDESKSINSLLFDSQRYDTITHHDKPCLAVSLPIEFHGQKWILHFTQSGVQSPLFQSKVLIVLISGIIISLLLFSLSISLLNTRYRAWQIAKQLISELKESESRLREVLENSLVASYKRNLETNSYDYLSSVFSRITGYTPDEMKTMPIETVVSFMHPDDATEIKRVIAGSISGVNGTAYQVEYRFRHKNGEYRWIHDQFTVIRDANGQPHALIGSLSDITDRKQAEKAQKNSENHAHALISAIPDMMFMLSRQGVYLDYKADIESLSYQMQSIIGKKNRDIMPPEFCDLIDEKINLTLQTGQMQVFEYQLQLPSKEICEYEARMVSGSSDEVIAIVRDVTERKKSERAMKFKNVQLIESNTEKDKFFSIIAHDLRSPFNAFLGFTRVMVEELENMSLEEIKKIVVSMRKSATNLYSLLENLLEWSMMHRGMTRFNPQSIPLALKIKESIELIIGSAQKKEIEISFDTSDDLSVFADVHMFETVIRNLITNAVKFTRKKGRITVSAEKSGGNTVEICVHDTGVGMSRAMVDNLFRLDGQTNRKGTEGEPSTGLGLIICKDFIEKHGGKILAESEEGKGSTFCFTLPEKMIPKIGEQQKNETSS